jgi:hypothetical protein
MAMVQQRLLDLSGQEPGQQEQAVYSHLGKYGILTTGKVSTHAQRKVRELNQTYKSQGLFEIELYPWEKIWSTESDSKGGTAR